MSIIRRKEDEKTKIKVVAMLVTMLMAFTTIYVEASEREQQPLETNLLPEAHISSNNENVVGAGISREMNRVRILLEVYSHDEISNFRANVFDSPILMFEQGRRSEYLVPDELEIHGQEYSLYGHEGFIDISPFNIRMNPGQRISTRGMWFLDQKDADFILIGSRMY